LKKGNNTDSTSGFGIPFGQSTKNGSKHKDSEMH